MPRRRPFPALVALALLASGLLAAAEEPLPEDRILAIVDGDPILASDLERAIGLGMAEPRAGESDAAFGRRVLDGLIAQRLRLHAVDRFGFEQVPVSEIEAAVAEIRSRFEDEEAFHLRLLQLGLDEPALAQLVARQLAILDFVDERLGARVFVTLEDIRRYYEEVLTPEMRRQGEEPPPLPRVREQIREVLREQRLTQEAEDWTAELRRQADVIDYYDRRREELPPLVRRFEAPP